LEQFWQAFASRGFVSDSWAFLLKLIPVILSNISVQWTNNKRLFKQESIICHSIICTSIQPASTVGRDERFGKFERHRQNQI